MNPIVDRLAAAPISWGVCEVPGWGYQLDRESVLADMRALGIVATELGPDGFLPEAPVDKTTLLGSYGLRPAGGFVPLVLHDADPMPAALAAIDAFVAAGVPTLVLAAASGRDGYDTRPALDAADWRNLLGRLDRIADEAARHGLVATLHPHVGTIVETEDEVARVLDGSSIPLCLDTGHLLVGGADPVRLAADSPDRIAHVHLKDADAALAEQVRSGKVAYGDAVARGLFLPLGRGDIDIAAIVRSLAAAGYAGWYVLEQDVMLSGEPEAGGVGAGPSANVRASVDFLREVADERR